MPTSSTPLLTRLLLILIGRRRDLSRHLLESVFDRSITWREITAFVGACLLSGGIGYTLLGYFSLAIAQLFICFTIAGYGHVDWWESEYGIGHSICVFIYYIYYIYSLNILLLCDLYLFLFLFINDSFYHSIIHYIYHSLYLSFIISIIHYIYH